MHRAAPLVALIGLASPAVALVVGSAAAEPRPVAKAVDAGAHARAEAGAPRKPARIPPDPPAMSEPRQWVFDLRWDKGEIFLLDVHEVDMGEKHATPRVMGRFALELFEGPTLIERVRFDFPMLGAGSAEDAGSGWKAAPSFTNKLRTRIGVLFPATSRGTRLELLDRATDERFTLPWPPVASERAPADGGR